jgi:HTH-type transcriptional regulator / antitoxin HigA
MDIHPIRTEADYRAALAKVSRMFDFAEEPLPGTPEGDRFDILVTLVEAYERKHFPIDAPDPIEAIKFTMEQRGLSPRDLEPMIGRSNRVYEVLAGRRPLTMRMVRELHRQLGIPAESLIGA